MSGQPLSPEVKVQVHLTFRIVGKSVDPDEITLALKLRPTRSAKAKEPISRRVTQPRKKGFWLLDSASGLAETEPFDRHAAWLFERIGSKVAIIDELKARHEVVDVWVSIRISSDHGGPSMDSTSLGQMATLGIPLNFDIFQDSSE